VDDICPGDNVHVSLSHGCARHIGCAAGSWRISIHCTNNTRHHCSTL
jgi:hypothetical protein